MSTKWDQRFLRLALEMCDWSKDPSTQVGCVIVGPDREIRTTGYNGLPRGCDDNNPNRIIRPQKYFYWEHAERNSLFNATRVGIPLLGCTAYVTSKPIKFGCCAECVRAMIQSGIVRIVQEPIAGDAQRWDASVQAGLELLAEAGVQNDKVAIE